MNIEYNNGRSHREGQCGSTTAMHLDGRTFDRAIGTKHTAIPGHWAQHGMAVSTFIKMEAGIRRHDFRFRKSAMRSGHNRLEDNILHGQSSRCGNFLETCLSMSI